MQREMLVPPLVPAMVNNLFWPVMSESSVSCLQSKLNCEVLYDDLAFEVRWAVAGDSVVLQLVSKLDENEYMSFGLSGHPEKSQMIGGDVVVAWVDKTTLKGNAFDYYLDSKSQCSGSRGSCPDTRIKANSNSVRLLNAALVNGYSIVTYQRPLSAHDELDRPVYTNGSQPIIWAVGPLNARQEVSYHRIANKRSVFLDFGRAPQWNCPLPEDQNANNGGEEKDQGIGAANQQITAVQPEKRPAATPAPHPTNGAWVIPPIQCYEPEDGVFYAQMGPTGGKHGYPAITGHVGWGISWYINGLLIPEINVVRGKTYTFVVEGGLDSDNPARYHPFYITDDPVGGYEHKTPQERANVRIFAGVSTDKRGNVTPTGTGRLCNWTPDPAQPLADEFASFGAYQRTLTLVCDEGNPGFVQWTPDHNTPDTVYYQCFTHRYLGWKINVLDSCDASVGAASETVSFETAAPSESGNSNQRAKEGEESAEEGDLEERPSIQVETRVRPLNPNLYGVSALADSAHLLQSPHAKAPLYIVKTVPQNDEPGLNSLKLNAPAFGLQRPANPLYQSIAIDQATLALLQEARQKEYEIQQQQHQQHESNSDPLASLAQTGPQQPGKTLYDHLKEETVKQEQATESGLSFQQLQSLSTLHPALDGLGAASLPTFPGQGGPSPNVALDHMKLVPPNLHLPTGYGVPKVARIPLSRHPGQQLMFPQQMKRPTSFGPRRPIMMPHRPSMYRPSSLMMPQVPPHNFAMKKKPYYRIPMMSSTTLRPMYMPGFTGRPITTLRPSKPFQIAGPTKLHKVPMPEESISSSTTITPSPGLIQHSTPFSLPNYQQLLMQQHHQLQHLQEQQHLEQLNHFQKQNQASRLQSQPPPQSLLPQSLLNPHAQPSAHFQQIFQAPFSSRPLSSIHSGFNPGSVVVEGGFKPIIQRREDFAQDRVDDEGFEDEEDSPETGTVKEMERRSSDVSEEEEDGESTNKPFEGQQTETFEPVFIPSPPDRNSLKPGKKSTTGSIVKDKREHEMMIVRRRPAVVRRPLYPSMVVRPFKIPPRGNSPQFRNKQPTDEEEEVSVSPKETVLAGDRIDAKYPDEMLPEASAIHNVVAFDGKSVEAIAPPASVPSGPGVAALVRSTPQFGPFKGELPSNPLDSDTQPSSVRQGHSPADGSSKTRGSSRTTLLTPVLSVEEPDSEESVSEDELTPDASESKEVFSLKEKAKDQVSKDKPNQKKAKVDEDTDDTDTDTDTDTDSELDSQLTPLYDEQMSTETAALEDEFIRKKRSAGSHHEPGHEGYQVHEHVHDHDHDHDQEQEENHHQQQQQQQHDHQHQAEKDLSAPKRSEDVKYHDYSQGTETSLATKAISSVSVMVLCYLAMYFS